MKFTLSWLKDHLDTKASLAEIKAKLDQIGLEVEGIDDPADKLGKFVVARVVDAKQHPQADRLRVLQVEIEPGKTLIIKFLTVSDPHPDGERTVFFELNGQPRDVNVLDRSRKPREAARLKADPNDPLQVAAPMPGLVVNVAVQNGDRVTKGQKLLTMEAMKMETTLYAEFDAKVTELLARPGTQVQTGDLVLRVERVGG